MLKIVINSHIKSDIALSHLLDTMKSNPRFHTHEIIIIIGGYYDYDTYVLEKKGNITRILCNHNSIDFTGLITLFELYSENTSDVYLYLHDTCKIGDDFYNKLESINLTNVSSIRLTKGPSMNMGIYSQNIINKFGDFLINAKNTEENRIVDFKDFCVKTEDHIFKQDTNNTVLDGYNQYIRSEPFDYYKTGTMRIVEYYPNLDLYKIKANWYLKPKNEWVLNN